jgi:CRISPR-associated endonuclease Csn1
VLKKTIKNANTEWGILDNDQVAKLANKHYTGWGRLSEKLLTKIKADNGKSIIDNLKEEPYRNFMRLLEDEKIAESIKNAQVKNETDLSYDLVADLAGSPALKRGIWQSLKIIQELEGKLGRENIGKIVVEMSRGNEVGRTTTRQKQIENYQNSFKVNTGKELSASLKEEFKKQETEAFGNEKLFLYFLQNGKDMYTGQTLDLDSLSSYEVDHIIPQTFIKDDSFNNKVLVTKKANQDKGGDSPTSAIIGRMKPFWLILMKNKQISKAKYANLTTKAGTYSNRKDAELKGFINRQLVENRQITKHVANILAKYFEDNNTAILTPKSALTSQFRQGVVYLPKDDFDFEAEMKGKASFEYNGKQFIDGVEVGVSKYTNSKFVKFYYHQPYKKNRDLNDYHHAHDAYLNAVVATYVYNTSKEEYRKNWVYGEYRRDRQKEEGKFATQRIDYHKQLLSGMADEKWVDKETGEVFLRDEVLANVEKALDYRDVNVVKKTEQQSGKFGDESVYKNNKNEKKVQTFAAGLKKHLDPEKYGGTKSPNSAFAVIVQDPKGNLKALSLSSMRSQKYFKKETDKLRFVQELYPKEKIESIVVEKVDKFTKFENNGVRRLVSSFQEGLKADQLSLSLSELQGLDIGNEQMLLSIFDKITDYLIRNKVYNEKHLENWKETVKQEFLEKDDKKQFILDALSISKAGTTNAKGLVKGKIGIASGQQQHKNKEFDVIHEGTTLIYQSITGLNETRRHL